MEKFQLIFIFVSVMIGVLAAAYFYSSTSIFVNILKRPLRLIAGGMMIITLGVLLGAFISYEINLGLLFYLFGIPLQAYFYMLYLIGSTMIFFGAHDFTFRHVK